MKKGAIPLFFLGVFLAAIWGENLAHAQVVNSGPPTSGTLVATILETVGYKGQQIVLQNLTSFIGNIGMLAWILSAAIAFGLIIFTRHWVNAIWLLIAPILFHFAIQTKVQASRVEWRFGVYTPTQGEQQQLFKESGPFEVSWLFHQMNRFISKNFSSLTSVLTSGESEWIMKSFLNRQEVLASLLARRPEDRGLLTFSREVIVGCNRELEAARAKAAGYRDPLYQSTADYKRADEFLRTPPHLRPPFALQTGPSIQYVAELLSSPKSAGAFPVQNACLIETEAALSSFGLNPARLASDDPVLRRFAESPQPCERLWCWMGLGFQNEVIGTLDGEQRARGLDAATFERIKKDIATKLTNVDYIADETDLTGQTPLNGKLPIQPDVSIIPVVVGGYLLRQTMEELDYHNPALAHFADQAGIELPPVQRDRNYDPKMAQFANQQNMQYQIAQAAQAETFVFMNVIPYLQGVLLYALAMLYPFFALFLFSLERIKNFLAFFLLWAWVKSWDLGFAFVMLIDKALWEFMPHSGFYDPQRDPNHSPVSIFASAFEGDPGFGLGTYYSIIGACLTAVPIITAQIFVASYASIAGHLVGGLKALGQAVGFGVQNVVGIKQATMFDSMREHGLMRYVKERSNIDDPKNHGSAAITQAYNGPLKALDDWYERLGQQLKLQGPDATIRTDDFYKMLTNATGAQAFAGNRNELATGSLALSRAHLLVGRMRSNLQTAIFKANNSHQYFKAFLNSPEFAHYNSLRTAVTGRREHWNFTAAPAMADQELNMAVMTQWAELQRMVANLSERPKLNPGR